MIVIRIGRPNLRCVGWVLGERSVVPNPADESCSVLGDPFPELWVGKRAAELGDQ